MYAMRVITVKAYIRPYCADLVGADWQLQSALEVRVSVARDIMAQYSHLSAGQIALPVSRIYAWEHSTRPQLRPVAMLPHRCQYRRYGRLGPVCPTVGLFWLKSITCLSQNLVDPK